MAPSACNRQPWRFVIVDEDEKKQAICDDARLPGISHNWFANVPVFVVLCVDRDILTHRLAASVSGLPYYMIDAGIAGEHFVLAATEYGLGTCWIGWFKERVVKHIINAPKRVRIVSLITLGYPKETPSPVPSKKRVAARDMAFCNSWATPFESP